MVTPSQVLQNMVDTIPRQDQPARCALLNGHIIIVIICFVLWWRHYLGRRGLHKGHDLSKETIFTQNNHVSAWTKPFNINLDFSLI